MNEDQRRRLADLFGDKEAEAILRAAETQNKALEAAGVAFKASTADLAATDAGARSEIEALKAEIAEIKALVNEVKALPGLLKDGLGLYRAAQQSTVEANTKAVADLRADVGALATYVRDQFAAGTRATQSGDTVIDGQNQYLQWLRAQNESGGGKQYQEKAPVADDGSFGAAILQGLKMAGLGG